MKSQEAARPTETKPAVYKRVQIKTNEWDSDASLSDEAKKKRAQFLAAAISESGRRCLANAAFMPGRS